MAQTRPDSYTVLKRITSWTVGGALIAALLQSFNSDWSGPGLLLTFSIIGSIIGFLTTLRRGS